MGRRSEGGQATLELALCLPLLALLLGVVIEVGLVVADHARVWHAAREGSRVAAVDASEERILEAARAGGLERLRVTVEPEATGRVLGEPVTVDVTYHPSGRLPLLGRIASSFSIEAEATMRIERP